MTIKRNHIQIDATEQAVGRLATQISKILRGKNKASFDPCRDEGDCVLILNADKVKFTGRKLVQKDYYHHTMHPGGINRTPMKKIFEKNPSEVIKRAVNGMLPKNNQRVDLMKRLTFKN